MKTNQAGIDLIKSFEGCSLVAVKLKGERYYTIGYGHYGADVKAGQTMTSAEAESLLKKDLEYFEGEVSKRVPFKLNANQFSALVSFTYNCGTGSLDRLVKNRTAKDIPDHILYYTNSAGGELYKAGLLRRRKAELALFLTPVRPESTPSPKKEEAEVITKGKVIVNGVEYEVERILNNGTNYIKIRDIARILGLEVGFTGNTPILNSKK